MKLLRIFCALILLGLLTVLAIEVWPRTTKGGLGSYVPAIRLAIKNYRKANRKWPESIKDLRKDGLLSNKVGSNFDSFTMRHDLQFQSQNYERFQLRAVGQGYFWTPRVFEREILMEKTHN